MKLSPSPQHFVHPTKESGKAATVESRLDVGAFVTIMFLPEDKESQTKMSTLPGESASAAYLPERIAD